MVTVYEKLDSRREVLTALGETMSRSDASALGYTIAPYAELVPASERIGTRHAVYSDLVRVPPFGELVTAASAKAAGFVVSNVEAPPRASTREDPQSSWRSAIMGLPEARDRTSATAELLTTQSHETLSVEAARAMLRGLPTEQTEDETTTMTTDTTANPERAERLAQISANAKAFNQQRGYGEGRSTNAPASQPRGASLASMDQTKLRRLAEIRMNALENGTAHEASSGEAKKLRYALTVEGMALSDVFAQLNLDTSKLRA